MRWTPGKARVKTDRRHSEQLARVHQAGEFNAAWLPGPEPKAVRDLTRWVCGNLKGIGRRLRRDRAADTPQGSTAYGTLRERGYAIEACLAPPR